MDMENIQELKAVALELMDALRASGLGAVELKSGHTKITVQAAAPVSAPGAPYTPLPSPLSAPAEGEQTIPSAVSKPELPAGVQVKSPLVGTFYAAPSPDAPPFVLVGQQVQEGDILFIIEAMKVMNEVKSPCDGTVISVLAQAGDIVEYNQPVMVIREQK